MVAIHGFGKGAGIGSASLLLGITLALPVVPQQKTAPNRSKKTVQKPAAAASFERDVLPVLRKNCISCHSGQSPRAGLDLSQFKTSQSVAAAPAVWERIGSNVASQHMPPAGMPPLAKAVRTRMVAWIQTTLAGDCGEKDPGRVTMRRLNRSEYDNTVRDLTGMDLHLAAETFPSDDVGYGFDNIGDVLSISPLLMEKYLNAAETVAHRAIVVPQPSKKRIDATEMRQGNGGGPSEAGQIFFSGGPAFLPYTFPGAGRYLVRVSASGDQAGPDKVRMAVLLNEKRVAEFEVPNPKDKPRTFEVPMEVASPGQQKIGIEFLNDYYKPGPPPEDRNLYVQWLEIETPSISWEDTSSTNRQIIFVKPQPGKHPEAARQIMARFASRAFRRPVRPAELDRLVQIVSLVEKDGEPFERGIQLGVQAVLSSPNFIFRVETEQADRKLDSYEIASRLSYFLWSSMPDERLFTLASKNKLQSPAVLATEAKRMLKDKRVSALGENFAGQWLNLRKLSLIQPDPKLYPGFNEKLRADMMTETREFFAHVVSEDRSVLDFLNAKYSFMNEDLAKHYGISGVQGEEFRKVSLLGTPRSGILTQGAILTLTSNPTRTSPVKRGKWVLDQLLNQPPPPPPPNVPDLKGKDELAGKTLRERLELHRKDPICASCHQRMDPIGFSLENFDGTGKWRTDDDGAKIDAVGVLPDGTKFDGPDELRAVLITRKEQFYSCLADKMMTFAIGRGMERSDKCYLDDITKKVSKNPAFSSFVAAIVQSEPFREKNPAKGKKK